MTAGTIAGSRVARPASVAVAEHGRSRSAWGRAPELSVTAGLGLLSVAAGYTSSRFGLPAAEPMFWLGVITLVLPIAARLMGSTASRRERVVLLILLGVGLNLVKVLHGPLALSFSDEFSAWLNVESIAATDRLFGHNPLIPATAFYPGLPISIFSMSELTGLPIFQAAFIVLAAARLVMMLSLFVFFEQVTRSARLAGVATLIYSVNPNFVFFGSQAAYESLALPMALLALALIARRRASAGRHAAILTLFALLAIGVTVVTHHLTSIALASFLSAWAIVAAARPSTRREAKFIMPFALVAVVGAMTWSLYFASILVDYLAPVLTGALNDFVRLATGQGGARELFRYAGQVAPPWEQLTGYAAVGLILLGLPIGLWRAVKLYGRDPAAVVLALAALAYPGTLALRLTALGAETSNRTSEFIFFGLGFVLALAVVAVPWRRFALRSAPVVMAVLITVVLMGGMIIGWARWARLPGPYLVGADTRSVERHGIEVARWTHDRLGPGNRTVSDRTNRLLLASYGRQRPVTGYGDAVDTKSLILSPRLGPAEERVARLGNVRYVLIDNRLSTSLPLSGVYVERGELTVIGVHRVPLSVQRLGKFELDPSISRVFDSGDIKIYDIELWWSR